MSIRPRAKYVGGAFTALLAVLLSFNLAWVANNRAMVRPVLPGDMAPVFELSTVGAKGELLAAKTPTTVAGQVTVLEFWATWCGPCLGSLPILQRLRNEHAKDKVRILAINSEGRGAAARARALFVQEGVNIDLLIDDRGAANAANAFKVSTIPHLVVLDGQGRVIWTKIGYRSKSALYEELNRVLHEAQAI